MGAAFRGALALATAVGGLQGLRLGAAVVEPMSSATSSLQLLLFPSPVFCSAIIDQGCHTKGKKN